MDYSALRYHDDMVRADHLLVHDGLKVDHRRLNMRTSMGAMDTWVWGEIHSGFIGARMSLASAETEIEGTQSHVPVYGNRFHAKRRVRVAQPELWVLCAVFRGKHYIGVC